MLIAAAVERGRLALDSRRDRQNVGRFPLVYEEDNLRLFSVDRAALPEPSDVFPIGATAPTIAYREPAGATRAGQMADLDSLIALVDRDSLESYTLHLQSYYRRLAGTYTNDLARDWLADRFIAFGYDSVAIDTFIGDLGGTPTECYNVVAYKIGTQFPNHHVIVGAHRDAVAVSPGADDNGSGTAGVLEIARVLKDVETDMTFIFILFDAEEFGLYGSWHYADEAEARGDSIVYMLNMDMIAHYENTDHAALYYGSDLTFSQLWQSLADSLLGITAVLSGSSGGSDHYPFTQKGYPATFAAEYIFSTVYHSSRDSTTYMSFPYMTKMVQVSLATAYKVSQTAAAAADDVSAGEWRLGRQRPGQSGGCCRVREQGLQADRSGAIRSLHAVTVAARQIGRMRIRHRRIKGFDLQLQLPPVTPATVLQGRESRGPRSASCVKTPVHEDVHRPQDFPKTRRGRACPAPGRSKRRPYGHGGQLSGYGLQPHGSHGARSIMLLYT